MSRYHGVYINLIINNNKLNNMENVTLNATEKKSFYLTELACEMADLFITHQYEHTSEQIYVDDGDGGTMYTDFIQEQFDAVYDKIEERLRNL